ncbi:uncharacterized protein TM35_000014660 [Trypanosoma theileri]|uniref:Uncharacterized protein n=1 Tax=Trypanosoma theileri TaxID=67003 RepID=A0A1X0PAI0_9TRYP|nr:uncharacterized protein TM35_000014660 [Trypanosoma theileri]ORC93589.1 hypothetical protein TM35_000014660 [Trypanosoma theileri]
MHRVDPFLASSSHDVKSKESFVNTVPLDAEVALATLVPVKSKESPQEMTSRPMQSSYRSRLCSGFPSTLGGTVPRGSFMRATRGERQIMEPIRMLHNCIRYFASHPEVYGTNIRALLDRELMYVMRVKASETALLMPGAVPVADTPLPPIGATRGKSQKLQHPALSKCGGWMVSPRTVDAAVSVGGGIGGEGMFGFGGTSFVEATPGFLSLLDKASRRMNVPEELFHSDEYEEGGEKLFLPVSSPTGVNASGNTLMDKSEPLLDVARPQESSRHRVVSVDEPHSVHTSNAVESNTKILIDGASYEISFLRSQLQQVEAAFNAKCIHLHELQNENNIQKAELQSTEKKLQQCTAKNQELQFHMENMRRELDAWKQRASELNLHQVNASQSSGNVSRRLEAMQFGEAKRELAHLSKLWRETEKSLQETRRSLESAEKEAEVSHKYLEDAFTLIERLERRNTRRDKFIESQRRLLVSLEEKYEKLMWCVQELQTMKGLQSYVDFLLSENPVWSLFLFVRLQRRLIGFAQFDEPLPNSPGPLYFRRTPCGGKLLDAYSPKLVYRLMMDHISGRVKTAESKFQVQFGIPIPRWRATYLIDYIGGHINKPTNNDDGDGNNNNNNNHDNNGNNNNNDGNDNNYNKYSDDHLEGSERKRRNLPILTLTSLLLPQQNEHVAGDVEIVDDIPNTAQYDQATIRLLLYCFWSERFMQYKRETEKRLKTARETRAALAENGIESSESKTDSSNAFNRPTTFIAALVDFVRHLYPSPSEAKAKEEINSTLKKTVVRGISVRNSNMRENLRVYFSSIVQITEDGTETPVTLSPQARELLYAMYYFAEEYKEVDSDYRLFYLVAFQQIPEIVAINFYASMEALRKGCDEALYRLLGANPSDHVEKDTANPSRVYSPKSMSTVGNVNMRKVHPDDAPADVLKKAVEMIDTAPLDQEGVSMEPDSDGEGFGLILPGRRSVVVVGSPTANPEAETTEVYTSPQKMKHNIREYLFSSEKSNTISPTNTKKGESQVIDSKTTKNNNNNDDDESKEIPTAWVSLNDRLATMLGPHSSLLKSLKESKNVNFSKIQSRKRQQFGKDSVSLSAARGLLPIEEVLALVHKHCFTTYAVSCCGGAYLSLVETLIPPSNDDVTEIAELDPLTPIGQIPPTEMHIKRLRFAIALDQPSSLVRFSDLFNVDTRYGTPSHFHDEYLRLTLDTYLEQQETWMGIVLSSVANQYESEEKENVEDSDGSISFPVLRMKFANELRHISLGFEQSNIFAKHFLNYSNLLYHEEDIRHEQFVDAPFFFNSPSLTRDELDEDILLMQERRWPIEDEASSCSLLYLSLAVRMTYVVWGFEATPAARLSVSLLPSERLRLMCLPEQDKETKNARERNFLREMKRDFNDALRRMKTGQTQHNELRRLLLEDMGIAPFSPRETNVVKFPLMSKEVSISAFGSDTSIDIHRLYAPWENEQQQFQQTQSDRGSAARSGRRSRSRRRSVRPETPRMDIATTDAVYFPETVSLLRFLGLGRVNKTKSDKKKKRVENAKGMSDVQNALLGTCLMNESLFISHQTEMAKLISQASKMPPTIIASPGRLSMAENPHPEPPEMAESSTWPAGTASGGGVEGHHDNMSMAAESIFPRDSTAQPFSGLPQVLDDEDDERVEEPQPQNVDPTAGVLDSLPIRMVYAGCAALSLM